MPADALVGAARLALLDEVGVLGDARGVVDDADAVPRAELAHGTQVGEADRLPAGHVDGRGDADVGDLLGAVLGDHALELGEVDVALEGVLARRVVGLVDDDVDEAPPGELLVQARGREVHVAGDHVARLDQHLAEDVLGATALVGRHEVTVAVDLADRRLEVVEVAAPGVGLVAEHHPRPLAVAHRRGAGVGEEVDVDVLAPEQEGVVAGLPDRRLALVAGRHPQGLDHLDLVGLRPAAATWSRHVRRLRAGCAAGWPSRGRSTPRPSPCCRPSCRRARWPARWCRS